MSEINPTCPGFSAKFSAHRLYTLCRACTPNPVEDNLAMCGETKGNADPPKEKEDDGAEAPKAHERYIDDIGYWCVPKDQDDLDPSLGRLPFTDDAGNEYWCIRLDQHPGPRYDSGGRKYPDYLD